MSIVRSRVPLLSSRDCSAFPYYSPVLLCRLASHGSREVKVAEWFWVSRRFQFLPSPTAVDSVYCSYLQIGFLECLEILAPEHLLDSADMEARSEDTGPSGCASSAHSTGSFLGSYAPPSPAAWDRSMSPCNTPARRSRFDSFGLLKTRLESRKDLDLEDAIFIPTFCSDDQPQTSHAVASVRARAGSNSPVRFQPLRPPSPVVASRVDLRHVKPQHIVAPSGEISVETALLANQMTTPECNSGLSVSLLSSRRAHAPKQPDFWRRPPSYQALLTLTPPSDGQGGTGRIPHDVESISREIKARQAWIDRQSGPGVTTVRSFIPCRAVQEQSGRGPSSDHHSPRPAAPSRGHSARDTTLHHYHYHYHYRYHHHDRHHYGQADLPADQNCAIYVVGIPAAASYADVLGSIRGGKVNICLLDPPSGHHATAAAKIVFFTRAGAEAFMQRHATVGVHVLARRVGAAVWNRIRYAAWPRPHQSRVLRVSGPARWMRFDYLDRFLRARLVFHEESRAVDVDVGVTAPDDRVVLVWRFASVRAQAELAYVAIEREMRGIFEVEYGPDPCAQPWV